MLYISSVLSHDELFVLLECLRGPGGGCAVSEWGGVCLRAPGGGGKCKDNALFCDHC